MLPPRFPAAETLERGAPLPYVDAAARRQVLAVVAAHSRPDDAIFVGCNDHRRVIMNDMDLYFLADRVGATRYMQFEPNIVTRADVQRTMIAEIERKRAPIAILRTVGCWWREPNLSNTPGASLVDEYLRARYTQAVTAFPYRVLLRSED